MGIPIAHLIGCCARWFACVKSPSRSTRDLPDCIANALVNVFCNMKVRTFDGETGMRCKEVDDLAMCSQMVLKQKALHQTAWLVERHNAFVRSALQRAESHAIKESLRISANTVQGLVTFMHNDVASLNLRTPHRALLGRRAHLLPPLEGGYRGGLDTKGQNNVVRVREVAAIAVIQVMVQHGFARGGKRNQIASMERSEHKPGDLVDIWYDPPNIETPGWRGPAQIATVNDGEGNVTARFQGRTVGRRHQEARAHMPYLVYLLALVSRNEYQWTIVRWEVENLTASFVMVGVVFQQSGWHVAPDHYNIYDGRRFLDAALP